MIRSLALDPYLAGKEITIIPGLAWLDKKFPGTLSMLLAILLSSVFVSIFIEFVVELLTAPSTYALTGFAEYFEYLVAATIATNLIGAVYFSRATDADLRSINSLDETLLPSFMPKMVVASFFPCLALYVGLFIAASELKHFSSTMAHLASDSEPRLLLAISIYFPLIAAANAIMIATMAAQAKSLTMIAHSIDIDLSQTDIYTRLSSPLVRLLVFVLFFLTIIPLIHLLGEPSIALLLGIFVLVSALGFASLYLYPVWIMRSRIRKAKQQQLVAIGQALQGDRDALESLTEALGHAPQKTDLLIMQMFVESRWEWPIASHVQKLMLFGILPPLSWAMAATVENLLY